MYNVGPASTTRAVNTFGRVHSRHGQLPQKWGLPFYDSVKQDDTSALIVVNIIDKTLYSNFHVNNMCWKGGTFKQRKTKKRG